MYRIFVAAMLIVMALSGALIAQTVPLPPTGTLGLGYINLPPGAHDTVLVLHSKGGSIAVMPRLTTDECNYWAQRLTPAPGTNIENYTIVSGTCVK